MNLLLRADDVLRGRAWTQSQRLRDSLGILVLQLVTFGVTYGAIMGTFGGLRYERILQPVFSAIKVPLLLIVTFAISLPSFFVLNTLLGVRADFVRVLRGLVATQAAATIILASLAPLTLFWYVAFEDYDAAILFNGVMFGVASISAQFLLYHHYRPLMEQNRAHRRLFRTWIIIYAFVGIQMGWVLRPFIGNPEQPTQFFRQGAWGNAYVEVARRALGVVRKISE